MSTVTTPDNHNERIAVIIVSGFLGAGKTTLIQKLLAPSFDRERTVILENEFGEVNFDGAMLKKRGLSVVSVLSGCICCTGTGNFTGAIQEAAEQFSPKQIVIEPTGVAKLSELLALFTQPPLLALCEVKQAITVVDVKNFKHLHYLTEEFYENQIMNSDVAILTKTDGLDQQVVDDVTRRLHEMAPHMLIVKRSWEQLSDDERETCLSYRKEYSSCHEHCHSCEHEHEHGHSHEHEHEPEDSHSHEDGHKHSHSRLHEHKHEDDRGHGHSHEHGHESSHSCEHEDGHEHCHGCDHGHEHSHEHHEHEHVFEAHSFEPVCSAEYMQENARVLSSGRLGVVLRVKGFLTAAEGTLMQLDYVPGELRITKAAAAAQGESPRLVFIGSGLHEKAIADFLQKR